MAKVTVRAKNPFSLVLGAVLLLVILWLLLGWLIMNGLDIIHDDWAAVPALGYASSLQVVILTYVVGGLWSLANSK
jgi:hypothetical protein